MSPRVSVIVPNYNHASFLKERMDSIFNQTYTDFEIILLDDCSSDDSPRMLKELEHHEQVSAVILNTENSGSTFRQWRKGMAQAKGELIWIAESDDSCTADFLAQAIQAFDSEPKTVVFYAQSLMVDKAGATIRDNKIWTDDLSEALWESDFQLDGKEFISEYLIHKNVIPNASAVLFDKSVGMPFLDEVQEYKMCGDWLFWLLLCAEGTVAYSAKRMNRFRSLVQSTRNHTSMGKKRRRLDEETRLLSVISKKGYVKEALLEARAEEMVNRWLHIHSKRSALSSPFYALLNHDIIALSKVELAKRLLH
jgi:glycosyltransferase involved in cell wall biosynthesis